LGTCIPGAGGPDRFYLGRRSRQEFYCIAVEVVEMAPAAAPPRKNLSGPPVKDDAFRRFQTWLCLSQTRENYVGRPASEGLETTSNQCPRQESNLVYDLRKVACESGTLRGLLVLRGPGVFSLGADFVRLPATPL